MKHRLNIDDSVIIAAVQDQFTIHLQSLEFLPVGEGAWAYKGADNEQNKWFIKLCRLNTSNVARVTSHLHNELGLSFVLSPILPESQTDTPKVNDNYLSIYPFIEGETLNYDALNKDYLTEIARDLRKLHSATLPQAIQALLLKETFDKYQDSASELMERAKNYTGNDKLLEHLRDFIASRWSSIDRILVNGRRISDYSKQHTYEFVVCHADIHPFNVIKTASGLVMIDWDGVMLAPRERDLVFYDSAIRTESDFHQAYGLDYQADSNLISYYNYEWVLQEYTDYAQRLFDVNLNEEVREYALKEFVGLFGSGEELGDVVKGALDSPLPDEC
jgi:spectinomycin phosphotransferase